MMNDPPQDEARLLATEAQMRVRLDWTMQQVRRQTRSPQPDRMDSTGPDISFEMAKCRLQSSTRMTELAPTNLRLHGNHTKSDRCTGKVGTVTRYRSRDD